MFIIIAQDTFATASYEIDTPAGERRARIALSAAGLESAPVWTGKHDWPVPTALRLYAVSDDEVTAVYTPSPALLRAATR